jgi:uncharacterized protein
MPSKTWIKLLDRLVFIPSRHPVDAEGRERRIVRLAGESASTGECELWGWDREADAGTAPDDGWAILKFPGAGGRAERASEFPAGLLPQGTVRGIWTVNPPGYGGSPGKPSLVDMPAVIRAVVSALEAWYPKARLFVTGNSLGCVWALHAARHPAVGGMLLRNPPPLKQMIAGRWRYNWWNLGLARWFAAAIPNELDAISNARQCRVPVLLIQSGNDRVVPLRWQELVAEALGGSAEKLVAPELGHEDPLPEHFREELQMRVTRLFGQPLSNRQGR